MGGLKPPPPTPGYATVQSNQILQKWFSKFSLIVFKWVTPDDPTFAIKGARRRGLGGSTPPSIGLSTKMQNKENITFLSLLSLFFCYDMDSKMI